MTSPTHTPGPWQVVQPRKFGGVLGDAGDRAISARGVLIAEAWEHCPNKTNPDGVVVDAEANTKLIAAAPSLLSALKIAKRALEDNGIDELMAGEFEIITDAIEQAETINLENSHGRN